MCILPPRVDILDVPISATNMQECLRILLPNIHSFKNKYICVSNAHTTVMAHEDFNYWNVQNSSLMSLPDGKPLSLIGRRQFPEMDRITGPDLMREIFSRSNELGLKHYFYGNTKENLERLIDTLSDSYPDLEVVGYEPSMFRSLSEQENIDLINRINSTSPDIVWVGLGAPLQENFCYEHRDHVDSLMIGVGGAFNILANITPEAPHWMQSMSLEWLYRLLMEPKRLFKRYLVTNSKFIFYLVTNHKRKTI